MDNEQKKYYLHTLTKDQNFQNEQVWELSNLINFEKNCNNNYNRKIKGKGVEFRPLFLGSLRLGKFTKKYNFFLRIELIMRDIMHDEKMAFKCIVRLIRSIVIDNQLGIIIFLMMNLENEYFLSKYKTMLEWDTDLFYNGSF